MTPPPYDEEGNRGQHIFLKPKVIQRKKVNGKWVEIDKTWEYENK